MSVPWKILAAGSSEILLLACTPKAASCLGQIVGIEAITLHQALGIRADGTGWRSTTKITHGLVLLEDDLRLSRPDFIEALINACPGAHIAVSYDSEQLPGPTRILAPGSTFVLTERFRARSEEHTSELQSLMRISYAVFCLKKKQYNAL